MKKTVILIFILSVAGLSGFYLGFMNRAVELVIHGPVTDGATSTAAMSGTSTSVILKGKEIGSGNIVNDLLGENIKTRLPSLPWYISRAAAITAYLLLFVVIVWGVGMNTGFLYRFTNPVEAWSIHKYLSISLGAMVLTHMSSLLFDKFLFFSLADIFIPFATDYKPIYVFLGIFAFYLLAIIMISSLAARLKWPKLWRVVHDFTYPLFGYVFVHSVFIGTDSQTLALKVVYWLTGTIFIAIVLFRLHRAFKRKKQ